MSAYRKDMPPPGNSHAPVSDPGDKYAELQAFFVRSDIPPEVAANVSRLCRALFGCATVSEFIECVVPACKMSYPTGAEAFRYLLEQRNRLSEAELLEYFEGRNTGAIVAARTLAMFFFKEPTAAPAQSTKCSPTIDVWSTDVSLDHHAHPHHEDAGESRESSESL